MSLARTRSLRLTPEQVVRHGAAIAAFCRVKTATDPEPWDFTVEFTPYTLRPTGRLLFHHPGQTIVVRDFVITLEKDTP